MDTRTFKANVKQASEYLAKNGIDVPNTILIEAFSRAFDRNWSTLRTRLAAPVSRKKSRSQAEEWDPASGAMTQDQYVRHGGNRCPFCGSRDITSKGIEADGPEAWDKNECLTCEGTWTSVYRISGFFDENPGDTNPHKITPIHPVRDDLVESIVEDVVHRARKYEFSYMGDPKMAEEAAWESDQLLGLNATLAEIEAAVMRLMMQEADDK